MGGRRTCLLSLFRHQHATGARRWLTVAESDRQGRGETVSSGRRRSLDQEIVRAISLGGKKVFGKSEPFMARFCGWKRPGDGKKLSEVAQQVLPADDAS